MTAQRIYVFGTLVASQTETYGQTWCHWPNAHWVGSNLAASNACQTGIVIMGKISSYRLFGRLCQYRCTSNHALHCSLNLLWLYNGCCLQFKCICSWHILTAQPHHLQYAKHVCRTAPTDVESCCLWIDSSWQAAKGQISCLAAVQSSWKVTGGQWARSSLKIVAHRGCNPNCRQLKDTRMADTRDQGKLSMCFELQCTHTPWCTFLQTWWWQPTERLAQMHHQHGFCSCISCNNRTRVMYFITRLAHLKV